MANTQGFNPNLDKITERELVPDIVHRLKISKPIPNPDNNTEGFYDANTKLETIIGRLITCIPGVINGQITDVSVYEKEISIGDKTVSLDIPYPSIIVAAYSTRLGIDLKDLIIYSNGAYQLSTDVPYTNTDTIKVFYL